MIELDLEPQFPPVSSPSPVYDAEINKRYSSPTSSCSTGTPEEPFGWQLARAQMEIDTLRKAWNEEHWLRNQAQEALRVKVIECTQLHTYYQGQVRVEITVQLGQLQQALELERLSLYNVRKVLSDERMQWHLAEKALKAESDQLKTQLAGEQARFNEAGKDLLEVFRDPISGELMTNPHQGSDGHTYSLNCAICALNRDQRSPFTREPMSKSNLVHSVLAEHGLTVIKKHWLNLIDASGKKDKPWKATDAVLDFRNEMADAIEAGSKDRAAQLLHLVDEATLNGTLVAPRGGEFNMLHFALSHGKTEIAQMIATDVKFKGLLDYTSTGITALHMAAALNSADTCRVILQRAGSQALVLGSKGELSVRKLSGPYWVKMPPGATALDWARNLALPDVIRVLSGPGPSVTQGVLTVAAVPAAGRIIAAHHRPAVQPTPLRPVVHSASIPGSGLHSAAQGYFVPQLPVQMVGTRSSMPIHGAVLRTATVVVHSATRWPGSFANYTPTQAGVKFAQSSAGPR